jgi:hypothetical protein
MNKTYVVYWDSSCQCELTRFTGQVTCTEGFTPEFRFWEGSLDVFGGGNYNYYTCLTGYKIVRVEPRDNAGGKLKIVLEEGEAI